MRKRDILENHLRDGDYLRKILSGVVVGILIFGALIVLIPQKTAASDLTFYGTVYEEGTTTTISGVNIKVASITTSTGPSTTSDSAGKYSIKVAGGAQAYYLTATKSGYMASTEDLAGLVGGSYKQDFYLAKKKGGLTITVKNSNNEYVSGAAITAKNSNGAIYTGYQTDSKGEADLFIASGSYTITVSANGYKEQSVSASVIADQSTTKTVTLTKSTTSTTQKGYLKVLVKDTSGTYLSGASVIAKSSSGTSYSGTSSSSGVAEIEVPAGSYSITVSKSGYRTQTASASVSANNLNTVSVLLSKSSSSSGSGTSGGSSGSGGKTPGLDVPVILTAIILTTGMVAIWKRKS